jgi:hypothetical protein
VVSLPLNASSICIAIPIKMQPTYAQAHTVILSGR